MLTSFISKVKKATPEDIFEISLQSAHAKEREVFIFEKSDLSDLLAKAQVEKVRQSFLQNNIHVKQITNSPHVLKFSENQAFVNNVMSFRYVPKAVFTIRDEVLIFDDFVAIYNEYELLVIENSSFAANQKQLFSSIWEQGQLPKLEFDYKPNHSFYNSIDLFINGIQIIVWPDAEAKNAYGAFDIKQLETFMHSIISQDNYYRDASYIICFIWAMEGKKMVDVWKFVDNYVDDRSGPLGDVRVYKEGTISTDAGLASGNTLLVLGYEEKLRRQSKDLKDYLGGPIPRLPLEIMNGMDFFG
ncbi:hypothetical protein KBD81_05770 [Candidatus Woesebacteria bacterium]|nr:hypothetical protein [Candidatus Woesebacteria bacterium]